MSGAQQQWNQQPAQGGLSYESLSRQVQALNEAFGTISDVLVEEVDALRVEMSRRHELVDAELGSLRGEVVRMSTALTEVRSQLSTGSGSGLSISQLEVGLQSLQKDVAALTAEMSSMNELPQRVEEHQTRIGQMQEANKKSSAALAQVNTDRCCTRLMIDCRTFQCLLRRLLLFVQTLVISWS